MAERPVVSVSHTSITDDLIGRRMSDTLRAICDSWNIRISHIQIASGIDHIILNAMSLPPGMPQMREISSLRDGGRTLYLSKNIPYDLFSSLEFFEIVRSAEAIFIDAFARTRTRKILPQEKELILKALSAGD